MLIRYAVIAIILASLAGCSAEAPDPAGATPESAAADAATDLQTASPNLACEPDNAGITLPEGFCAVLVADELGRARHLDVTEDGDVYVALREGENGGIIALRDTDGDGRADERAQFGDHYGTGIDVHNGHLYFGTNETILRYNMTPGQLKPAGEHTVLIDGLPEQRQHAVKPFDFDEQGNIYVNVGGPANACQEEMRTPESPGQNPCPLREWQASIWRFDTNKTAQTQQRDGYRYASGIRNSVAIAWDPASKGLFVAQHGRDSLDTLWPKLFDSEQSRDNPAEEFLKLEDGADFMWPYCYWDTGLDKKILAPEFGGDGEKVGDCDMAPDPLVAFPAHWGPNDLIFYTGRQFPARYHGGAFIAFHGSWNRAPFPQGGYNVVFVPMKDGAVTDDWETFADGFKGEDPLMSPRDARFRPTGLAQGPDGSLYISDSVTGRIWRVIYRGEPTL